MRVNAGDNSAKKPSRLVLNKGVISMKGNMMNWDLTIPQAILHAEKYNFDGKLVSRELDGSINSTHMESQLSDLKSWLMPLQNLVLINMIELQLLLGIIVGTLKPILLCLAWELSFIHLTQGIPLTN